MQNGVDVLLCGNLQQYLILSKLFNDFSTIPVTPLKRCLQYLLKYNTLKLTQDFF